LRMCDIGIPVCNTICNGNTLYVTMDVGLYENANRRLIQMDERTLKVD
jgi:hypothetical protein